jgi:hypothetical protein
MRLRDMKYIGFKHQRESKQNSDKLTYSMWRLLVSYNLSCLDKIFCRAQCSIS